MYLSSGIDALLIQGSACERSCLPLKERANYGLLGFELKTKKLNERFFRQAVIEFVVYGYRSPFPFQNVGGPKHVS